jgi:hypothetical protein
LYETRFVAQYTTQTAGKIGTQVASVLEASGHAPANVSMEIEEGDVVVIATIRYHTPTSHESNLIIDAWRKVNGKVQVERNHKLRPEQFRSSAMAGREGRKIRAHIADEVERMCELGVGSRGILDYLQECEAVATELKEFVQSLRAPV